MGRHRGRNPSPVALRASIRVPAIWILATTRRLKQIDSSDRSHALHMHDQLFPGRRTTTRSLGPSAKKEKERPLLDSALRFLRLHDTINQESISLASAHL